MTERSWNVLFLCTANSARSILGEALLNAMGRGRYRGFSAGSHPAGRVNPGALDVLLRNRVSADGLRSKSWDEFAAPGAPALDIVITVCDRAAGEHCPVWPGGPLRAHWGIDDPAAVEGGEAALRRAFDLAFFRMQARIALFLTLPAARLDRQELAARLADIGRLTELPR